MTEYEIAQRTFSTNWDRLKAERLAREAAGTPLMGKKAKTKKKSVPQDQAEAKRQENG
jgi:hypothetical protein